RVWHSHRGVTSSSFAVEPVWTSCVVAVLGSRVAWSVLRVLLSERWCLRVKLVAVHDTVDHDVRLTGMRPPGEPLAGTASREWAIGCQPQLARWREFLPCPVWEN